ncbi:MAG: hypothetical protein MHM6MM_003392 [Cercozoa sp. M6MM]
MSLPGEMALSKAERMSLLSDAALLAHLEAGNVVIEPFDKDNLSTSSYDVTLGRFFFRESAARPGETIYNPYDEAHVRRVWGQVQQAESVAEWRKRTGLRLANVSDEDYLIWLRPGETILAHTNEFIGGRNTVTTMMKARSSMGRNFIEVCKCAGWGDIGYVNRWTMEVTNNSRHYSIPLVVGRRIAQIVFFDTVGTQDRRQYQDTGKYQTATDVETLMDQWEPHLMLPRMYRDRDVHSVRPVVPIPYELAHDEKKKQQQAELPEGAGDENTPSTN